MEFFKKSINRILIIPIGFLLLSIIASFSVFITNPNLFSFRKNSAKFFCGTVSEKLPKNIRKGKEIFMINCAACHGLKKEMTGPAISKTDSTIYHKWIRTRFFVESNSKTFEYGLEFHNLNSSNLDSTDLDNLFEYLHYE